MKHFLVILTLLATVGATATPSSADTQKTNVRVTNVRSFVNGGTHIYFSQPINSACGNVLRANGAGSSDVVRVALAALLSGKQVDLQSEDSKSGAFCNLVWLRIRE